MDTKIFAAIIIAAIVLIVIVTLFVLRRRKSDRLKRLFGPEYNRIVNGQHGDTKRAETLLAERQKRVEKFSIRPLKKEDRDRYAQEWTAVQQEFVDDPSFAIAEADKLLITVMAARGYPMVDFEQMAADISVNHPGVVQDYRSAQAVALQHKKGAASTEDMRQAMIHFRSLFDELLESPNHEKMGVLHGRAS